MKRLLLIASVLATAAHAQSKITISGALDVAAVRAKPVGQLTVSSLDSGVSGPSHLAFSGSEDLGSGLGALMKLDSAIAVDTGQTAPAFWSRESTVGLRTSLGTFTLGRNSNPLFDMARDANEFGESRYSPLLLAVGYTTSSALNAAQDNSMRWTSPGGSPVTGALLYRFIETGTSLYVSGNVEWRPAQTGLVIRLAADRSTPVGASGDLKSLLAGPELDLGWIRLSAVGAVQRNTTLKRKSSGVQLGMDTALWGGTFRLAASTASKSALDGSASSRINVTTLGYEYGLSRRSSLYAIASRQHVTALSSGHAGAVGVRHLF